jgi:hypothetical protein
MDEIAYDVAPHAPVPEWAKPARRDDNIGRLAWRLVANKPDYTAGPALVEAIREQSGDPAADELARHLMIAAANIPADPEMFENPRGLRMIMENVAGKIRRAVRPYLHDLTSAFGVLAELESRSRAPEKPPEKRTTQLDTVMIKLSEGYSVGDSVRLPDGRRGIIVVPRGADGMAGVLVAENDHPSTGPMQFAEADGY